MTEKIRLRIWLAGAAPIALVVALGVYVMTPRKEPAARRSAPSAREWTEPPPPVALQGATAVASTSQPPPPVGAQTAPTATTETETSEDPPEPVPEIEAMYRLPPGSERWSDEQKKAYRLKTFDDLGARERTLERELAAAKRAGDRKTQLRKTATLSYLREKRAEVEGLMHQADALRARDGSEPEQKFGD